MVYFDFDFFNIFPKGKCEIFHWKFELAETFQFGAKLEGFRNEIDNYGWGYCENIIWHIWLFAVYIEFLETTCTCLKI